MEDKTSDRVFLVEPKSPVHDALEAIQTQRNGAFATIKAFTEKHGVDVYGSAPDNYTFYIRGNVNKDMWVKSQGPLTRYRPRKNSAAGKALAAEIAALPPFPDAQSAVKAIPDTKHQDLVFDGRYMKRPHIRFYNKTTGALIVGIPQYNKHPFSAPSWMKEIKEWEALKIIDESKEPTND